MRKSFILFSLIVAASMVLSSCGTAATPTEAPEVVDVPVVATEAPVVATEAPEVSLPTSPYVGSGMLDGNGVPGDFFSDVHIRKGFSYAFDFETFIDDVYLGEAVQATQLALPGMPGYDPDQEHYYFDLDKAAEEFKLADLDHDGIPAGDDPEGDVWTTGFRLQMMYNTGNTTRQTVSEIVATNLNEVNELFLVEVLGLPWPSYLAAIRGKLAPIANAGWQEDIHDPHNWYQPYTTGAYGARQNLPDDLKAEFKAYLDAGVAEVDPAKRTEIYKGFNQLYYDQAVGLPTVIGTSHGFEQKWVEGRVLNPLFSGGYYYAISKTDDANDPTTYVSATIGDADTFDPALAYDTASGEIIQNVYETLVFYDGAATDKFVPQLAESWTVSDDGTVWTFNIREGVKFHEGGDLTASDVAYSYQRGILQGGYNSPQWLLAEPFLGVGNDDITAIVDEWASADDRDSLMANDAATLVAACETVKNAIVADDDAGTVTMTLAQSWGPFLATIAQSWGSIMDKEWVIENGGWDGSCDTWQNYYSMTSAEDPFTPIANGTGAFALEYWDQGSEIALVRNDNYWKEPATLERVLIKIIPEWGTRFAMLQAGDADDAGVPVANRPQADAMSGEIRIFDLEANEYGPVQEICAYNPDALGVEKFTVCAEGETGLGGPLRVYIGRPSVSMVVLTYTFVIQ